MSTSQDHTHQGVISTDAGDVLVLVQSHHTVLVKAGEQYSSSDPAPREPLDLGRGVQVSVHAHFKLKDGAWKAWNPSLHRVDQQRGKDVTGAQARRATNAIIDALTTWPELPELLAAAGRDASQQEAEKRLEMAAQLKRAADQLEVEAFELLQGGRVSYRKRRCEHYGADESVTVVQRADGTFLDAIPTLPVLYGATNQRGRIVCDEEQE